jgi:hypothetical protein
MRPNIQRLLWVRSGPKSRVRVVSAAHSITGVTGTKRHSHFVQISDICSATNCTLLDHLVSEREQHRRQFEAKRLRGLEIDDEIKLDRLLDRQFRWLCAVENLINIRSGALYEIGD